MKQFKKKLSLLIRQEMYLSREAEAEIFSIIHSLPSPGKIYRFLLTLYHFKILWTFLVEEQVKIIESIYEELSHNADRELYTRIITITFGENHNEKDRNRSSGIKNFILFTKSNMHNESDFQIKSGLSLLLLKTIQTTPEFVDEVETEELIPALLFFKDTISYASIFNHLIRLFGIHTVVTCTVNLFMKHPDKINIFLFNTLIENAVTLKVNQKSIVLVKKIQTLIFLLAQQELLGMDKVSQLQSRLLIELDRTHYLHIMYSPPLTSNIKKNPCKHRKRVLNKRFVLLNKMKGGKSP